MTLKTGEINDNEQNQPNQGGAKMPNVKEDNSQEETFKKLAELTSQVNELQKKLNDKAESEKLKLPEPQGQQSFNPNDLNALIATFAEAIKESKKEVDYEKGVDEEMIDPEDYDEQGVRFCCPRVGYVITDDKRKGRRVLLPYNKKEIFFNHIGTRIIKQGKYDSTAPISAYRSHSRKETKWLKEHSLFNVEFYENANSAVNVDGNKILRMSNTMAILKNYELNQLMKVCTDYGIQVTPEDPGIMRMNLAIEMTTRQIAAEAKRTEDTIQEAYKAEQLLERK